MARALYIAIFIFAGFTFLTVRAEEENTSTSDEVIDAALKSAGDEAALRSKGQFQENLVDVENDKRTVIIRPYKPPKRCKGQRNSPTCCAGFVIDVPKRKTCCRGRIVLKRLANYLCPRPKVSANCGRYLYNRIQSQCCHRMVIPRSAPCKLRRCGKKHYITYGFHCCRGKVLRNYQKCPKLFIIRKG